MTEKPTLAAAEKAITNVASIIEPLIADIEGGNVFAAIGALDELPQILADVQVIKAYVATI